MARAAGKRARCRPSRDARLQETARAHVVRARARADVGEQLLLDQVAQALRHDLWTRVARDLAHGAALVLAACAAPHPRVATSESRCYGLPESDAGAVRDQGCFSRTIVVSQSRERASTLCETTTVLSTQKYPCVLLCAGRTQAGFVRHQLGVTTDFESSSNSPTTGWYYHNRSRAPLGAVDATPCATVPCVWMAHLRISRPCILSSSPCGSCACRRARRGETQV